jgi:hypothetical protein
VSVAQQELVRVQTWLRGSAGETPAVKGATVAFAADIDWRSRPDVAGPG